MRRLLPARAPRERAEPPARGGRAVRGRDDARLALLPLLPDLSADDAGSGTLLGVGTPPVVGLGFLLRGAVLMVTWRLLGRREFFARRREVADPAVLGGRAGTG